jgi:DNA-binding GntR family transcriptional regulator
MTIDRPESRAVFEPPKSISDQVYELLRDRIIVQEIKSGERLVEREVAARLKISRTPIREAFRRLEQDGLMVRVPQGGMRVTEISAETAQEIFGIRAVLEAFAGELACQKVDAATLDELKRILEEARLILEPGKFDPEVHMMGLFKLNTLFHDTICQAARSEYLVKMIKNVRMMILRFRTLSIQDEKARLQAWREHRQMIVLLESGDKGKMSRLARKHVLGAGKAALKYIA